jgi:hypothetical protein
MHRLIGSLVIGIALVFMLVGAAPATTECNDSPDTPEAPASIDVQTGDNEPIPAVSCDTSWERATYRECWGLPYLVYLQDHPFVQNGWYMRTGFPGINR